MTTKPRDALAEWAQHNPFRRASPELIRRVEAELAKRKRDGKRLERTEVEDAPF